MASGPSRDAAQPERHPSKRFTPLPKATRAAVLAVADQFAKGGTDDLENVYIFQTPEVIKAGGVAALAQAGDPKKVIRETKERIFAA
jgi:type I restriction enzyme R subunit